MSTRYNPARWVCVYKPEYCGGNFPYHGEMRPCPLAPKCKDYGGTRTPYEYTFQMSALHRGKKFRGHILEMHDPEWKRQHKRRLQALHAAFQTEQYLSTLQRQREKYRQRERPPKEDKPPRPNGAILPCGEDCGSCPYDECRYSDRDADAYYHEAARAKKLLKDKNYRIAHRDEVNAARAAKHRKRMETDPEYAMKRREANRAWMQKARADPQKKAAMTQRDGERKKQKWQTDAEYAEHQRDLQRERNRRYRERQRIKKERENAQEKKGSNENE